MRVLCADNARPYVSPFRSAGTRVESHFRSDSNASLIVDAEEAELRMVK